MSNELPLIKSLARHRTIASSQDNLNNREPNISQIDAEQPPWSYSEKISKKKRNKKAPQEVSSRKPTAPKVPKKRRTADFRDPRFDNRDGFTLDPNILANRYAFLSEIRETEIEDLKNASWEISDKLKSKETPEMLERKFCVEKALDRMVQQKKRRQRFTEIHDAKMELKRAERERVKATGKRPYFHTLNDAQQLVASRKKSQKGGRDRTEERHNKKIAARKKRELPQRRE